ncbi:unnamed protein product [Leptidea sinapis]|uniref:FLYWCH-type domain-containing protein n=1 Tax=Leptidea sinapis TaxID=189913 RepID=A0A5E4PX97_9NEOP|nr:unnamed protein product [Leptidea sinapis]
MEVYNGTNLQSNVQPGQKYSDDVQFFMNTAGKPVGVLNGYTFYPDGRSNKTERWRCTAGGTCRARFTVIRNSNNIFRMAEEHSHDRPRILIKNGIVHRLTNVKGKPVAVKNGYTFCRDGRSKMTERWQCTFGRHCRARFTSIRSNKFVCRLVEDHNHEKSTILILNVQFLKNAKGNPVAVFNGYTFCSGGKSNLTERWRCTVGSTCKARFTIDKRNHSVFRLTEDHNHDKPRFIIRNGVLAVLVKRGLLLIRGIIPYSVWQKIIITTNPDLLSEMGSCITIFLTSTLGKTIAVLNGFTYYKDGSGKRTERWRCTQAGRCKARFTIFTIVYLRNPLGKPVAVLNGFKYYRDGENAKTVRWRCCKGGGCKARFSVLKSTQQLYRVNEEHCHGKPNIVIRKGITKYVSLINFTAKFFWNPTGKPLAVFNGYTFYCAGINKNTNRWRCTTMGSCSARLITFKDTAQLIRIKNGHNHERPNFIVKDDTLIRFLVKSNGKQIAVLDGFTFYLARVRHTKSFWRCTKAGHCKARFTYDTNSAYQTLIQFNEHIHEASKFIVLEWVEKRSGGLLAIIDKFTFYCGVRSRTTSAWRCTKVKFVRKLSGKPLAIINGYTFYLHKRRWRTQNWSCTKGGDCKGRFTIGHELGQILSGNLVHSHEPPRHFVHQVTLAKSRYTGKHIVMLDNYTYYCKRQIKKTHYFSWYCSTHNWKGCNAKIVLDQHLAIIEAEAQHNHPPAEYLFQESSM